MSKNYSSDDAVARITKPDCKLAIFDVSPTIECRWIAISNKEHSLLKVFGSTHEMLDFVAHEQIKGATVADDDNWLDYQASASGFDTWAEYVNDERGYVDDERGEEDKATT